MATGSPKVVRFNEEATVYEEEELSDSDLDSDLDEGVESDTYFEQSLFPPIGYIGELT